MSFLIFMYGCCIGSFVNVLVYRLPLDLDVIRGRSYCPCCKKVLKWGEMIPIVSYIYLGGKCSNCHTKISLRYPCIECICGMLAVGIYYYKGCTLEALIAYLTGVLLLTISYIDYEHMIIPDSLNACIALLGILHHVLVLGHIDVSSLGVGMSIIIFMLGMNHMVEDAFGGGDIKLIAAASLMIGNRMSIAICIACITACVYVCYLLIRGRIESRGHIPFGPFLAIGIWMCM